MSKYFSIEFSISAALTAEEIWPNGDAPDNPTKEDVQAVLDAAGTDEILSEWMLYDGRFDKFIASGPYGKDD